MTTPRALSKAAHARPVASVFALVLAACSSGKTMSSSDAASSGVGGATGTNATNASGAGGAGGSGVGGHAVASSTTGSSSATGSTATSSTNGTSTASTSTGGGTCALSASSVRITEVDVGTTVLNNEVDANGANLGLEPLAISPMPSGGSRVAWMGNDSMAHVVQLDAKDQVVAGSAVALPAFDFQDLYADDDGGVVLVSRAALGGSAADHNCGNINNLCGLVANYPTADPCFDMYMVRFDGAKETWAAKLTDTTGTLPAYDSSATATTNVVFIWWYAHNGRLAFDGSNYGAYFGAAISVSQACVMPSTLTTGINIHQGDRLKVVSKTGTVATGGFNFGCSHSGYERIVWDATAKKFVTICKNDAPTGGQSGRLAIAPATTTIRPVDLSYSDLGSVVVDPAGGYWAITSDIRSGQTANANGLADIHLVHFTTGASDKDIVLASDAGLNDRAPHLAPYGNGRLLALWETSTATGDLTQNDKNRKMHAQILDASTGAASGAPFDVTGVVGNRYHDARSFPDGSVAYPAPGSTKTSIKILRFLPCP